MPTELNGAKVEKVIEELKCMIHGISGMEVEDMDAEGRLIAYGLDSMLLLKMAKQINSQYEVEISLDIFFTTLNTLQFVAEHIVENSTVLLEEVKMMDSPAVPVDPPMVHAESVQTNEINKKEAAEVKMADNFEELDIHMILKVFENQYDIMVKQNGILKAFIQKKVQ